ncbi:MAG TPA: hypothetical protein VFQ84_08960 [Arenimonas sp.]|uniref:hypothetical protein n=1 Tax=Arenimonas sp. TaxID=1872635 RepID=UPI002D7E7D8A|nr:hypothetical protein [Arenimonas sp.]HEU0153459.1 hypothetical protein [Arenimonas sp.]
MTATKFLCIDDQQDSSVDDLLLNLENNGPVRFVRRAPQGLDQQLPTIAEFVKEAKGGAIGLLIDLRLDVDPDSDGNRVAYRGPTLAQEIRTRMTEGELPSFPIVLWSVNGKFRQSYFGDETSHDLFDEVLGKDEEVVAAPGDVALKLASLAWGYVALVNVTERDALHRLGLEGANDAPVYARFASEYLDIVGTKGKHEIAHLVLKELIGAEGLLITEGMLAARLGVDVGASAEAWFQLKDALKGAMYAGPFCEGWARWWWYRVEDWWASISDGKADLKRLTAAERVERLTAALGGNLVPAEPIDASYSTKYSTLCVATDRPLDPIDGLRVVRRSARGWHDAVYVSVYGALERKNKDRWRLDPLERDRFDRIKEERSKEK